MRLGLEAPVSETEGNWLRLKERFREGRGAEGQVEERGEEGVEEGAQIPIVHASAAEAEVVPTSAPLEESIPIPTPTPILKRQKAPQPEPVEVVEEVEDPSLKGLSKGEREIILLRRKFGMSWCLESYFCAY